jgi:hypothetical protein
MKRLSGRELAAEIGCPVSILDATLTAYNKAAEAGTDEWGKKYYNAMPFVYDAPAAYCTVLPCPREFVL